MRVLLALLSAMMLSVAGCTDADDPAEPTATPTPAPAGDEPTPTEGAGATPEATPQPTPTEDPGPEPPAKQSGDFDGSLSLVASSATHRWDIVEGHAKVVVHVTGDHTLEGTPAASLKDPSGAEVASDDSLDYTLTVENPAAGTWTLDVSLSGVDATYEGTWCAGTGC